MKSQTFNQIKKIHINIFKNVHIIWDVLKFTIFISKLYSFTPNQQLYYLTNISTTKLSTIDIIQLDFLIYFNCHAFNILLPICIVNFLKCILICFKRYYGGYRDHILCNPRVSILVSLKFFYKLFEKLEKVYIENNKLQNIKYCDYLLNIVQ